MRSTGWTWFRRSRPIPQPPPRWRRRSRPTGRLPSPGYFRESPATLKKFVDSGQLGIFQNAYWGHPAYKLPPEANLMAVAHYLEALKWQKEIVKIHTVFGGKNPHPNYLVGGMACADLRCRATTPSTSSGSTWCSGLIDGARRHRGRPVHSGPAGDGVVLSGVDQVSAAVWAITWPTAICRRTASAIVRKFRFPRGVILNKNLSEVLPLDLTDTGADAGRGRPLLVRVPGRQDGAASLGRRHRGQLHRAEAAVQATG